MGPLAISVGVELGGGFEIALMTDISVIARNTKLGMPATRFLGPRWAACTCSSTGWARCWRDAFC